MWGKKDKTGLLHKAFHASRQGGKDTLPQCFDISSIPAFAEAMSPDTLVSLLRGKQGYFRE